MTEESTTPDLVELTRAYYELMDRDWDIDAVMRFWAPDAVFDLSPMGLLTRIEGAAAIRESIADWWATWEQHHHYVDEIRDVGHGVVLVVLREDGRIMGSDAWVEQRAARVNVWVRDKIVLSVAFGDIDRARAHAERLAQERG
jgi:ketosteroid isomerase-like protein